MKAHREQLVCFVALIALATAAQARKVVDMMESNLPPGAVPLEWVEATVNRQIITSGEVDELLQAYLYERGITELDDLTYQEARSAVVEQAINDLLIVEEARRRDLVVRKDVLDAAVEAELRRQRRRFANPADFERELAQSGATLSTWQYELRQKIERQFLIENFLKSVAVAAGPVTPEEVQQYREQHPDADEKLERVLLRHIQLNVPPDAPQAQLDARLEEIKVIAARLQAGESFATLAAELSEDEGSKAQGGNIGFFGRGEWPEADAAFDHEAGDIFGPIRDDKGLHIVQVLRKQTVADYLQNRKRREALRSYLADLREVAEIDVKLKPFSLYRAERRRFAAEPPAE